MSEFDTWLGERMSDPEFVRHYEAAKADMDAAVDEVCRHECCVIWRHPDGRNLGGYGPAGCECGCDEDTCSVCGHVGPTVRPDATGAAMCGTCWLINDGGAA